MVESILLSEYNNIIMVLNREKQMIKLFEDEEMNLCNRIRFGCFRT